MLPATQPIYERRQELAARSEIVQDVLEDGWARAKKVAGETLSEVKAAMHM
jgi:hypothetical protein